MPDCPRCHQLVDAQAVTCPYCRMQLKAYGHPGIPLHRATGDTYLCDSCTYHADDTCTFPQRPYAKECTLYQNLEQVKAVKQQQDTRQTLRLWFQRNTGLVMLLGLILFSFLVALLR